MNFKTISDKVKNNAGSILLIGFLLVITISPDAKSWVLRQLVAVGLFRAEIKKDAANNLPAAASFGFVNTEGITASTADLKGKVVFINFWASWCPPCRAEMPSVVALYQKFKHDNRYVFLFINEDDDKVKAIQYLEKNKYDIPLYTRTGTVPAEIFSGTLPTTIVIDKTGKVVLKHEGMAGYNTDKFIGQLKELL